MTKIDLAAELKDLEPRRGRFRWPNHEYVRGWGVFGLPFDSGHYLALRVFPENDFAPYRTVWHRDPAGSWSIFADAPRLDIACPRFYGAACAVNVHARVDVRWTGPMSLHVTVDTPALAWTVEASETPHIGTLMPQRMYFIESSSATLDGQDLGNPAHSADPIDIGGIPVPSRGVLAVGQAAWEIFDPAEYQRTRAELEGT